MCRINFIYVKNKQSKQILRKAGYVELPEEKYEGRVGFLKGSCSCNSFVGSMSDSKEATYADWQECESRRELSNLLEIQTLMHTPDYPAQRAEIKQKWQELNRKTDELTQPILEYEEQATDEAYQKYRGKKLNEAMERIYEEIDRRYEALEATEPYRTYDKEKEKLEEENPILFGSMFYYLTQEEFDAENAEEQTEDDFDLTEEDLRALSREERKMLKKLDDDIKDDGPYIIDRAVERCKAEISNQKAEEEFAEYRAIFQKILTAEPSFFFATCWNEAENYLKCETVSLKNLTMEHLARLPFDGYLEITR